MITAAIVTFCVIAAYLALTALVATFTGGDE